MTACAFICGSILFCVLFICVLALCINSGRISRMEEEFDAKRLRQPAPGTSSSRDVASRIGREDRFNLERDKS